MAARKKRKVTRLFGAPAFALLRAAPWPYQLIAAVVAVAALWYAVNGVYQVLRKPAELFFPAGEEKTILNLPRGYGYPLKASDGLLLNHMIHNLTPVPTQVYMVYVADFVPKNSRAARGMRSVRPIWIDRKSVV